jgi:ureidoglycolate lyase
VKISPIAPLANGYENACPSGKAAQARLSMFACFPRKLRREKQSGHRQSAVNDILNGKVHSEGGEQDSEGGEQDGEGEEEEPDFEGPVFDVRILERHPYTTQTFIPLDLSSQKRVLRDRVPDKKSHDWKGYGEGDVGITLDGTAEQDEEQEEPIYLVIVAPTLKGQSAAATSATTSKDTAVSSSDPTTMSTIGTLSDPVNEGTVDSNRVLIRDPPDLENLRAFIARGGQAVTYGPGTWHAPMVVLGPRRVDFVVVQYVNGVEDEDCQEAAFKDGIVVDLKSLSEEEDEFWDDLKKLSKL